MLSFHRRITRAPPAPQPPPSPDSLAARPRALRYAASRATTQLRTVAPATPRSPPGPGAQRKAAHRATASPSPRCAHPDPPTRPARLRPTTPLIVRSRRPRPSHHRSGPCPLLASGSPACASAPVRLRSTSGSAGAAPPAPRPRRRRPRQQPPPSARSSHDTVLATHPLATAATWCPK